MLARTGYLYALYTLLCAQGRRRCQHRLKAFEAKKWTLRGRATMKVLRAGEAEGMSQWRELSKAVSLWGSSVHESTLRQRASSPSARLCCSTNIFSKFARSHVTGFDFSAMKPHGFGQRVPRRPCGLISYLTHERRQRDWASTPIHSFW
jgi:hypothetical protein